MTKSSNVLNNYSWQDLDRNKFAMNNCKAKFGDPYKKKMQLDKNYENAIGVSLHMPLNTKLDKLDSRRLVRVTLLRSKACSKL